MTVPSSHLLGLHWPPSLLKRFDKIGQGHDTYQSDERFSGKLQNRSCGSGKYFSIAAWHLATTSVRLHARGGPAPAIAAFLTAVSLRSRGMQRTSSSLIRCAYAPYSIALLKFWYRSRKVAGKGRRTPFCDTTMDRYSGPVHEKWVKSRPQWAV